MSIYALARVWDHSQQRGTALLLLLAMADRADELGVCWAGANWLAGRARLARRQTIRTIQALEEAGEIVVVRSRRPNGQNIVNHYIVGSGATPELMSAAQERIRELLDMRGGSVIHDTSVAEDTRGSVAEDTREGGLHDTTIVAGMTPDPYSYPEDKEGDQLPSASLLWRAALDELEPQMARATFRQWLEGTRARWDDGALVVLCRNAAAADVLANRLRDVVERAVLAAAGTPYPIRFEVGN